MTISDHAIDAERLRGHPDAALDDAGRRARLRSLLGAAIGGLLVAAVAAAALGPAILAGPSGSPLASAIFAWSFLGMSAGALVPAVWTFGRRTAARLGWPRLAGVAVVALPAAVLFGLVTWIAWGMLQGILGFLAGMAAAALLEPALRRLPLAAQWWILGVAGALWALAVIASVPGSPLRLG